MAQDIFAREVDLGEPLSADAVRLVFPTIGIEGMLMVQASFQYQQNITRLWEVGSAKTYFFAGRTEGQITAKRVIGNSNAALSFVSKFGNVCNMVHNSLSLVLKAGCGASAKGTIRGTLQAEGVVIKSVAYSITAQEMLINEDISMLFAYMKSSS